jgi:phosphoglycolate phosphatase-like HAD superfamily hydrolase
MKTAIIFDIDGTLIDSESIDAYYFIRAIKEIAGDIHINEDWSNYTKVTDVGIVSEILEQNDITATAAMVASIRERFCSLLQQFFQDGGTCMPIPGSIEFLNRLREDDSISCGIATGGWSKTALMKCNTAGIDISALPLSSSDDGDNRETIMQHCLKKMEGPFHRIVYIGDGLWDRAASRALGWRFIGIGGKLKGKCRNWFGDFTDAPLLMEIINQSE